MKKKIIPVFLLLIICGGFFFWLWKREQGLVLRGEVEGTTCPHIAEVPGKIIEMNLELGRPVKTGEVIARLDNTDQKYVLEQLHINLEKGRLTLASLRNDIESLERVWNTGGVSRNELDKARLKENIADADIREMESKIRQMEETLTKYEIKASCDGIVISVNYNIGSMVNTGYTIAEISADKEKYVVCYVPKEYSERISYGQFFTVKSGSEEVQGEARFIDVKSQYTPKDMRTSAAKNKVSVKLKLLLPQDTALKPGTRVEVIVR